jgi:hypothetical protein
MERLDWYDCFESYRWGGKDNKEDDKFVEALFELLSRCTVGKNYRAVRVFLDKRQLEDGRRFDLDFAKALCNSSVVVPVISPESLKKMISHNPGEIDNMLVEWCMAMECYSSSMSRVSAVFPILFGTRVMKRDDHLMETCEISNLFSQSLLHQLSTAVPKASLDRALQMLRDCGIEVVNELVFSNRTVQQIVSELTKFLGILAWEVAPSTLMCDCSKRVMEVINLQVLRMEEKDNGKMHYIANEKLADMYGILMDERCHLTPLEVKARVEEYGIVQPSDISEFDMSDVEGFANMLKSLKKRAFVRLYSEYVTQSTENMTSNSFCVDIVESERDTIRAVGGREDVVSVMTQQGMKSNSQEWKRANIAIIGEGRAG